MRLAAVEDERAVREVVGVVEAPRPAVEALPVEAQVDSSSAPRAGELEEAVVVVASAEGARPVAGGEGRGFVEEEELRELAGISGERCQPLNSSRQAIHRRVA